LLRAQIIDDTNLRAKALFIDDYRGPYEVIRFSLNSDVW